MPTWLGWTYPSVIPKKIRTSLRALGCWAQLRRWMPRASLAAPNGLSGLRRFMDTRVEAPVNA